MRPARTVILLLAVLAAAAPAMATSGRVTDPDGAPIVGAKACLMVAGREGLCSTTDEQGWYRLPAGAVPSVRIVARGFLPRAVAAVDQEGVIVLERAAAVRARLLDATTGQPISKGELFLERTTGKRHGPFPVNAAGLWIPSFEPGLVLPTGRATGYREQVAAGVELRAGEVTEITLRLQPQAPTSEPATP